MGPATVGQAAEHAGIYEIDSAEAWVALVRRYPRDVTLTRRSPWWVTTHWRGAWLLPDWAAVRSRYDGVHLTVLGFLEAAGRMFRIGRAATGLAVWEPDATWWLGDVVSLGEPEGWDRDVDQIELYANMELGDDGSLRIVDEDGS